MGRPEYYLDVPFTPSGATPGWVDEAFRKISKAVFRHGGEGVGSSLSLREESALKEGVSYVLKNFEPAKAELQMSLAQVFAQGYLMGREHEATYGGPKSDINLGHL